MNYCYIRSSTNNPTEINSQLELLKAYSNEVIIESVQKPTADLLEDANSGLHKLLQRIHHGDTICVKDVDRLAKGDIFSTAKFYLHLLDKDIKLLVVNENGEQKIELTEFSDRIKGLAYMAGVNTALNSEAE